MTTAADVLDVARSYLGVHEDPPHSNRTVIGEKFGWNGVAWCAESVTVWQHEAGNGGFVGSASCSVLVGRYQDGTNGTWETDPRPGDQGFLGSHGQDHTFLVEINNGDGTVVTIEGNWRDQVMRVNRSIGSIYGFGRPGYVGAVAGQVSATGGRPVLRQGSKGEAVKAWQQCVGATADGDFGPATAQATRDFQVKLGITVDGEVGPETYAAMDRVLAFLAAQGPAAPAAPDYPAFPGEVARGSSGDAVAQVQQRLADRGWNISVDGDFGAKTDKVVRAFQAQKGLDVDGIVGPATWESMWTSPIT